MVVLPLEDVELHVKNFLRGVGLCNFSKKWEECALYTALSEKALAQSLSLKEVKDVVKRFLKLKDVTSRGGKHQRRNIGMTMLHGMYMSTSWVLVMAEYLPLHKR